ncbi:unnamed protein product [Angiostrongylus costaricensis]|uniref:Cyclic nucleotide-binding domain-containing protein n=1 Tax=Angiostrongylus costaricensis TaxID=334426 RepID=A0A0R3PPH0_ANGCS|nr:unnamed protein product [Angiostrongylus costaricensis]
MMHKETDILGILVYYVLVPLKCVVVFVLRRDVSHVFSQIVYLHAMDSLRREQAIILKNPELLESLREVVVGLYRDRSFHNIVPFGDVVL